MLNELSKHKSCSHQILMLLLQEVERNGEALPKSAKCQIRAVVTQQKPGNRQWALRWLLRQKN